MNTNDIMERIKSSFCNLTNFKVRENALEVITAYSTMNSKFVSVFIVLTNEKIVITDSGWIDQNYYDTPIFDNSEEIIKRITNSLQQSFSVKSTYDKSGIEFFYKSGKSIDEIPSLVFDMANFIVGVVNAFCIQFKDEKEEKERESFRKNANTFLKSVYNDKVKLRDSLDDFKNIKFNAIVNQRTNLYLITYVTGSSQIYFENDLRKSIVNFEIADKSRLKSFIREKITIFNDQSEGYMPERSANIIDLLKEKTTREPIRWSEKETLLDVIGN